MKFKLILLFLSVLFSTSAFACLNAYQFKIFPIGIYQDNIVTIDAKIYRTSIFEGNRRYNLNLKTEKVGDIMWIIETYKTIYDKKQNIISSFALDTIYTIKRDYTKDLQKVYLKGFNLIVSDIPEIDLFKPDYLSFCNYRKKCNILTAKNDTIKSIDIVEYKGRNFPVTITQNEHYYGFNNSSYFAKNALSSYNISSTRIYKTGNIEIVIGHFGTGHEIAMGWITDDPNKKPKDEDDRVIIATEYIPDIKFNDIRTSVYQEPLLHHGFGFDIFIISEKE